jgi:hypothetical protein
VALLHVLPIGQVQYKPVYIADVLVDLQEQRHGRRAGLDAAGAGAGRANGQQLTVKRWISSSFLTV